MMHIVGVHIYRLAWRAFCSCGWDNFFGQARLAQDSAMAHYKGNLGE